jgi:thymidine phosphorylase
VGFSGLLALGVTVQAGQPLAWVHAATDGAAVQAVAAVQAALTLADADTPAAPAAASPLLARWG